MFQQYKGCQCRHLDDGGDCLLGFCCGRSDRETTLGIYLSTSLVSEEKSVMPIHIVPLVCLYLVLLIGAGQHAVASSWNAELDTGQQISVNPSTNRTEIQSGAGQGKPLWDGVHRLSNGSTITIRSGVMVPNEALSTYQPAPVSPPVPADAVGDDIRVPTRPGRRGSCVELVMRSCGLHGSCGGAESCVLALQLKQAQHQPGASRMGNVDWAERHCREALQDGIRFPRCDREPPLETTACWQLVERVCAGAPNCLYSPSCREAKELFELEQSALSRGADGELEVIRPRCLEVLGDHVFFPPCR